MPYSLVGSSIVLSLASTEGTVDVLTPRQVDTVLTPPLITARAIDGTLAFTSVKDQIELRIRQSRIEVQDLSGDVAQGSRVPVVAMGAFELVGGQLTAFGLNYRFEIPTPDVAAGQYIAEHLFAHGRLAKIGEVAGRSVTIRVIEGEAEYNIKVEPRWGEIENSLMFVDVNVHENAPQTIAQFETRWLDERYLERWDHVGTLVERLLEVRRS